MDHRTIQSILSDISSNVTEITQTDNDEELEQAYKDSFTTEQQKIRDKEVTKLLKYYTSEYKLKTKMNKWFKILLFALSCIILCVFSCIFVYLLMNMYKIDNKNTIAGIVQTVSVCVTFLTMVVGILKIITKYVFSDKDEEYITKIVEIIQNNDLENKKENIKTSREIQE